MRKLDSFIVDDHATIKDAVLQIENNNCRCVVVVRSGAKRTVTGVFSQGDVLRAILTGVDVHTPLNRILSPTFKYLKTRDMTKAAELVSAGLTLIPIVTESYALCDVITFFDVIEHYRAALAARKDAKA